MKIDKSKDHAGVNTQTPFPPGLAKPALRALVVAGYSHLEQRATGCETALQQLHGLGPSAIRKLSARVLHELGQLFAEDDASPLATSWREKNLGTSDRRTASNRTRL